MDGICALDPRRDLVDRSETEVDPVELAVQPSRGELGQRQILGTQDTFDEAVHLLSLAHPAW
jgi:hypothetical protein